YLTRKKGTRSPVRAQREPGMSRHEKTRLSLRPRRATKTARAGLRKTPVREQGNENRSPKPVGTTESLLHARARRRVRVVRESRSLRSVRRTRAAAVAGRPAIRRAAGVLAVRGRHGRGHETVAAGTGRLQVR